MFGLSILHTLSHIIQKVIQAAGTVYSLTIDNRRDRKEKLFKNAWNEYEKKSC